MKIKRRTIVLAVIMVCSSVLLQAQQDSTLKPMFSQLENSFEGLKSEIPYKIYSMKSKQFYWLWVQSGFATKQLIVYTPKKGKTTSFEANAYLQDLTSYLLESNYVTHENVSSVVEGFKLFGYYLLNKKGEKLLKAALKILDNNYGTKKFDIEKLVYDIKKQEAYKESLERQEEKRTKSTTVPQKEINNKEEEKTLSKQEEPLTIKVESDSLNKVEGNMQKQVDKAKKVEDSVKGQVDKLKDPKKVELEVKVN